MTPSSRRTLLLLGVLLLSGVLCPGCNKPDRIARIYEDPYPVPRTLAVAPFLNQSGSDYLDVLAVTDEFYTELQQVKNLDVVAVNRVLATMSRMGINKISNPDDAVRLVDALGIDGVIVGSITQYNPYRPPKMAMAVQLNTSGTDDDVDELPAQHINPGKLARAAKPFALQAGKTMLPRVGVVRIFDADHNDVIDRLKQYAADRTGNDRPSGWETYLTSRRYLRFVSHEVIGEMLALERDWLDQKQISSVDGE